MARFITSSSHPNHYPSHSVPEFVLVGPSNAGKSSFINSLSSSRIALISNKPGKTRILNFYDFDKFYLVDTPGYGYALGSKTSVSALSKILDAYFSNRDCVEGALQICSSHPLSDKDIEVMKYLMSRFHNYRLVINKIDKLTISQMHKLKSSIREFISLDLVIFISAKNKLNLQEVSKLIKTWI